MRQDNTRQIQYKTGQDKNIPIFKMKVCDVEVKIWFNFYWQKYAPYLKECMEDVESNLRERNPTLLKYYKPVWYFKEVKEKFTHLYL